MRKQSFSLENYPASEILAQLSKKKSSQNLRQLFNKESARAQKFSIDAAGLYLDYSRHWIDTDIHTALIELAHQAEVSRGIHDLFTGVKINNTEQRAVLHTALRSYNPSPIIIDGSNITEHIISTRNKMKILTQKIHQKIWRGYTGKPIKYLVNIGIGGSYLGIKMVTEALQLYNTGIAHFYVANIDPRALTTVLNQIDPESTLFIIASKTFNTLETLINAKEAKKWMRAQGCPQQDFNKHFIAISANIPAALAFDIAPENILPAWDWVGGRYSLWSAIGLTISLAIGFENFEALLKGAEEMDQHFRHQPLSQNMPVILALLSVWYQNFHQAHSHSVIAYDESLNDFPAYLQQLDMESNGKNTTKTGHPITMHTGSVLWGGVGTNGQHAYHQLLHQGTRLIPIDFIAVAQNHYPIGTQQTWLFANMLAQSNALTFGSSQKEVSQNLLKKGLSSQEIKALLPHKIMPGNKPNSLIFIEKITPKTLGALIALYEHKVFIQGLIWNINSFDQWGVELGKELSHTLFHTLNNNHNFNEMDSSTQCIIKRFQQVHSKQGAL